MYWTLPKTNGVKSVVDIVVNQNHHSITCKYSEQSYSYTSSFKQKLEPMFELYVINWPGSTQSIDYVVTLIHVTHSFT